MDHLLSLFSFFAAWFRLLSLSTRHIQSGSSSLENPLQSKFFASSQNSHRRLSTPKLLKKTSRITGRNCRRRERKMFILNHYLDWLILPSCWFSEGLKVFVNFKLKTRAFIQTEHDETRWNRTEFHHFPRKARWPKTSTNIDNAVSGKTFILQISPFSVTAQIVFHHLDYKSKSRNTKVIQFQCSAVKINFSEAKRKRRNESESWILINFT